MQTTVPYQKLNAMFKHLDEFVCSDTPIVIVLDKNKLSLKAVTENGYAFVVHTVCQIECSDADDIPGVPKTTPNTLSGILMSLDPDTILVDSNGESWSPDNIDDAGDDHAEYTVCNDAIWKLKPNGFLDGFPKYKILNLKKMDPMTLEDTDTR